MIAIIYFKSQQHRGNLIEMIKKSVTAKDYWLPRLLQPFPKRVIESKLKIKSGRYPRSIQIFKVCLFMPCVYLIQGMRFTSHSTNEISTIKAQLELNTGYLDICSETRGFRKWKEPLKMTGNEVAKINCLWSENLIHIIMWLCQSELLSAAS